MKNCLIVLFSVLIFISCNSGINNKSKRNENWAWWIDANTGKGEWIPVEVDNTAQNGRYTTFYFNGQIHKEGKLVDGKDVDTMRIYDTQGKLVAYKFFNSDTSIDYIINDGFYREYESDSMVLGEGIIKNHTYGVPWTDYYLNGKKKSKTVYSKDSAWIMEYYDNGQMKDSGYLYDIHNYLIYKGWYENGQLKEINNVKDNFYDGIKTEYYQTGDKSKLNIKTISLWKKGIEDGVQLDYYENGQMKDSAYVIVKTPRDIAKYWREDGSLELELTFKNGAFFNRKEYDNSGMLVRDTTIQ